MWRGASVLLVMLAALGACGGEDDESNADGGPAGAASPTAEVLRLQLASSAFENGGEIPVEYSCDGANTPFPLSWEGVPDGTRAFALIFDDPDAPGDEPYVHWLMYDIPATMMGFETVSQDKRLPNGAAQGENSRGGIGYAGPCPPSGETHTYVMHVYALDTALGLEPGASREELDAAMEGHVLAAGELRGAFGR